MPAYVIAEVTTGSDPRHDPHARYSIWLRAAQTLRDGRRGVHALRAFTCPFDSVHELPACPPPLRNGKPANEPGLKDTVLVDGGETVTITTNFENPGMWMYHCHIPEHSGNGMMAELEVVPQ